MRTALPDRAIQGFGTCGLWPYDPNVFTDVDFEPALMTEEDLPEVSPPNACSPNHETPPQQEDANGDAPEVRKQPTDPDQETVNEVSPDHQADFEVIPTSGDGRCLFRSLVIGMDRRLQAAQRDEHGKLLNTVLHAVETGKADSLRAQAISFMWDNYDEYKDLDSETINADQPDWIRFGSMDERIVAMADPTFLPGELELMATSKVLGKKIVVLGTDSMVIQTYGEDTLSRLLVQFRNIGQNVGHYNCVLDRRMNEPQGPTSQAETPEASSFSPPRPPDFPTPDQQTHVSPSCSFVPPDPKASTSRKEEIAELIRGFSPLPKIQSKRPRSRKAESATVLTSSPFKARLEQKRSKQTVQKKTQQKKKASQGKSQKKRKRHEPEKDSDQEEEDWPCLICCEPYRNSRPRDVWVQCQVCLHWAHEECTQGTAQFVCPNCDSDDSE